MCLWENEAVACFVVGLQIPPTLKSQDWKKKKKRKRKKRRKSGVGKKNKTHLPLSVVWCFPPPVYEREREDFFFFWVIGLQAGSVDQLTPKWTVLQNDKKMLYSFIWRRDYFTNRGLHNMRVKKMVDGQNDTKRVCEITWENLQEVNRLDNNKEEKGNFFLTLCIFGWSGFFFVFVFSILFLFFWS